PFGRRHGFCGGFHRSGKKCCCHRGKGKKHFHDAWVSSRRLAYAPSAAKSVNEPTISLGIDRARLRTAGEGELICAGGSRPTDRRGIGGRRSGCGRSGFLRSFATGPRRGLASLAQSPAPNLTRAAPTSARKGRRAAR